MRLIPSEYFLIPTSIEQATNSNREVIYNPHAISPGSEFFLMDFDYIHYDEAGNRTHKTASTGSMLNGSYYVLTLPGAHSESIFDNTNQALQDSINNLSNLKMEFDRVVIITKDSVEDLYEWVMNAVKKAPWYD